LDKNDSQNPESTELIESLVEILQRFAVYGEELWDEQNFRDGYKKFQVDFLLTVES
jgi:hypothetical protein